MTDAVVVIPSVVKVTLPTAESGKGLHVTERKKLGEKLPSIGHDKETKF